MYRGSLEYLLAYVCCEYTKFRFLVGFSTLETGSAGRSCTGAYIPQNQNLSQGLLLRLLHTINMNHISGEFPNEELEQEKQCIGSIAGMRLC